MIEDLLLSVGVDIFARGLTGLAFKKAYEMLRILEAERIGCLTDIGCLIKKQHLRSGKHTPMYIFLCGHTAFTLHQIAWKNRSRRSLNRAINPSLITSRTVNCRL